MLRFVENNSLKKGGRRILGVVGLMIVVAGCDASSNPQAVGKAGPMTAPSVAPVVAPKAQFKDDANFVFEPSVSDDSALISQGSVNQGSSNQSSSNQSSEIGSATQVEPFQQRPRAPVQLASAETSINRPAPTRIFTEAQLHKNNTLLLLSMEPDIRAIQLTKFLRGYLTEEQIREAVKLILPYDHNFDVLKKRRAEILEYARDGQNVAQQLRKNKEEIVIFSEVMRDKVLNEIMTEEQRQERIFNRKQSGRE